jgi:hypothetical protein
MVRLAKVFASQAFPVRRFLSRRTVRSRTLKNASADPVPSVYRTQATERAFAVNSGRRTLLVLWIPGRRVVVLSMFFFAPQKHVRASVCSSHVVIIWLGGGAHTSASISLSNWSADVQSLQDSYSSWRAELGRWRRPRHGRCCVEGTPRLPGLRPSDVPAGSSWSCRQPR